jgi:hypothetical protein
MEYTICMMAYAKGCVHITDKKVVNLGTMEKSYLHLSMNHHGGKLAWGIVVGAKNVR